MQKLYDLNNEIQQLEIQLREKKKDYQNNLESFLTQYFNGEIPSILPLSKNQFIRINKNNFKIVKGEQGQLYWKVIGRLVTVKDGQATYGNSEKELYQGEYEKFSVAFKKYTIEDAKNMTKSVFPIAHRYHNGCDFANYGYQLFENKELELILIWRKGANAYVNRGHTVTAESRLQVLSNFDHQMRTYQKSEKFSKYFKENAISPETQKLLEGFLRNNSHDITLSEGGRLSKKTILNNAKTINEIFGANAVNDIISKLEHHLKVKKVDESQISDKPKEMKNSTQHKHKDSKEVILNGIKLKV